MADSNALVIGGGIAGLTAALELARFGVQVDVVERELFPGGHVAKLACKATDACVKCGACLIAASLEAARAHPGIRLHTACHVETIRKSKRFAYTLHSEAPRIITEACTGCGICQDVCPADAVAGGAVPCGVPFFAIRREACQYVKDQSCTLCRDGCPAGAIQLETAGQATGGQADMVVLATGFQTFDPGSKPYGYGIFPNVITNLDLEGILRREGRMVRPSDGLDPKRVAFIQCVGSRDAKLGHLWCSTFCCGAALRAARLVKARRPETEITVFYIDIQNFGKDFESAYRKAQRDMRFIRTIPSEAFPISDAGLRLSYVEDSSREAREEAFDLVVLSVGMVPASESDQAAGALGLALAPSGFVSRTAQDHAEGVFAAGTARGPMSIADAVADARSAAWQALRFLGQTGASPQRVPTERRPLCSGFILAGNG
jgi:heterodisulfide reductase subunit A2